MLLVGHCNLNDLLLLCDLMHLSAVTELDVCLQYLLLQVSVLCMQTLWGGWCIIGPHHRFYFAGDTGYSDTIFKLIRSQYGPFDLAALPIGAYSPR